MRGEEVEAAEFGVRADGTLFHERVSDVSCDGRALASAGGANVACRLARQPLTAGCHVLQRDARRIMAGSGATERRDQFAPDRRAHQRFTDQHGVGAGGASPGGVGSRWRCRFR